MKIRTGILLTIVIVMSIALSCESGVADTGIPEEPVQEEASGDDSDTPETPDEPDVPDTPDTPDTPATPDTTDVPDNPDTPDMPDGQSIVIIDPGESPSERFIVPQHPEMEHVVSYDEFFDPFQDYLDEYGNVDYVCAQGNGTAWPVVTSDYQLRFYQGSSSSKGGSYIRIRSHNGARLVSVSASTSSYTKLAYYFNGRPSTRSETFELAAGADVTLDCPENCDEICLTCMGLSQQERWNMSHLTVKYLGGFTDDDFYEPPVEYGPLVKVKLPFSEDFESGFPTTAKPSYYKYGITAGPDNLMWSTWYGSFSDQKPVRGNQSVQLRVYQEEDDYDKPQFGYVKMEYFIKDLSSVSFKYWFSHYWNEAVISYCDFGSAEWKGSRSIFLENYSDRETTRDFKYVLDEGRKHDAKIKIEIDPATGFPSRDHYDFKFDDFIFE